VTQDFLSHLANKTDTNSHPAASLIHFRYAKNNSVVGLRIFPQKLKV